MDAMKAMPKVPPSWQSKLQFLHSDVLRERHKVMRAQFTLYSTLNTYCLGPYNPK